MKRLLIAFLLFFAVEIAAHPSVEKEVPAIVDESYQVIEWIGGGSQGRVYRAIDRFSGFDVAIKVFQENRLIFPDCREAENEARVSRPLEDVPFVRGFIEKLSDDIIVLEYIPGRTLEKRIKTDPLTQQEADEYITQLLDGMEEILARHVIPIDIALDNLMIDEERNHLRLVDAAFFIDMDAIIQTFSERETPFFDSKELTCSFTFFVHVTASDVFHIINCLREKSGLSPLPEHLRLNCLHLRESAADQIEELELLRSLFEAWISEVRGELQEKAA